MAKGIGLTAIEMVQLPSLLQNTYITCEQASILRSWQPIPLLFSLYWTCQRTQCLRGFSSVDTPSILSVSEQNLNYPLKTFLFKNGGEESRTLVHTICVNTVLHVSVSFSHLAFNRLEKTQQISSEVCIISLLNVLCYSLATRRVHVHST